MADMFKTDRFTFKRDFCTEYLMFNQQRRSTPFCLTLFNAASLMGKMFFNIRKVDKKTKDQQKYDSKFTVLVGNDSFLRVTNALVHTETKANTI